MNASAAKTRARLVRPVGKWATLGMALVVLALPAWLLWDELESFRLRDDDFAYLIECRSGAEPLANLWTPHNTHVVPLFRLLTAAASRLAGGPGGLATALGLVNYLSLVLLMLGVGHLVAWEARRMGPGLAAMTLVGVTTVIEPAATWYSAGQTIWAALGVVGTLVLLQFWRVWPNPATLAAAALSAGLAPLFWMGGLVAGPAGAAYLWASGRRRAASAPILGTIAAVGLIAGIAGGRILEAAGEGPSAGPWAPLWGLAYTFQAIAESILLASLGLDGAVTAVQGAVFLGAIAVGWLARRRGRRTSPLEAAGAVTAVLAYFLAFTLRAGYRFDDLRALGWYDTIPLVGVVLFVTGWWQRAREPGVTPGRPSPLRVGDGLIVLMLSLGLLLLHVPRAKRIFIGKGPPLLDSETTKFPVPSLQRLRAVYLADELAGRQERALVRLGQAAEVARRLGISRAMIRRTFGRLVLPGWPEAIVDQDALDLLAFPDSGPENDPARVRAALGDLLKPEAVGRPPWLQLDEVWPQPRRGR